MAIYQPAGESEHSLADDNGLSLFATTVVGLVPGDTKEDFSTPSAESSDFLKSLLLPPRRPGDLGCLGDYRVSTVLGAGGMGVVLAAHDPLLNRMIAIKVLRP
jgi:hypothetical protein